MAKLWTIGIFIILASLDNAAIMMIPNMVLPISRDLGVTEAAIGGMTAAVILTTAATAVFWGYFGDRNRRKTLLFWGTIVWVTGTFLSAATSSYTALFGAQLLTAIGLGSIASIGFSVVSDYVPPHRRGFALSFWGLSQGAGGLIGGVAASQLGAGDWRRPMWVLAITGAVFALLFLTTRDPIRGASDPELAGKADLVEEHIELNHIPALIRRPSNIWLIAKGFTAQLAYGSLLWVPLLYQTKIVELGYSIETATKAGGLYYALLQLAAITSIGAGWLGDRWQAKNPSGRARLSMIGVLGAIPFFLAFFFVPLRDLPLTDGAGSGQITSEVLQSFVSNGWVMTAFVLSFIAVVLTATDSPNAFALIVDVNVPEHRGTIFGLSSFADGVGRSIGNGVTGWVSVGILAGAVGSTGYATALSLFQVFFIPTGYCYWRLTKTTPGDIQAVKRTLVERARSAPAD